MNFESFCETWIEQHRIYLHQLLSLSAEESCRHRVAGESEHPQRQQQAKEVVDRVMAHYESYYRAKSEAAKRDVLSVFSPSWAPSLERALLWIGGWRPTTVFHLIYSETGLRFEAQLPDLLLRGIRSGDIGDLSPAQLARVSDLQCNTVRLENEISEEMAELQEGLADPLSHIGLGQDLISALESVLHRADALRLRTLHSVVEILTPVQAVDFLIAAAELQIGIHEWGLERDRKRSDPRTSN